ncbi:GNAT family N-acetyltransferase [Brassicibacter mesophilus]|jgi:N-acetylglutamate synthase-like GNAT family acetyltransferase|uniref:GNAT family N-acetyltransferase n=1 Tax=Brassicibacter mesophilus TaxID=745119 RepID=UPI003D1EAF23
MIIGRKIKISGEKERLEDILSYYNIKDYNDKNSIIYVLEEDDTIIGGCRISLYNDIGVLEYLVIEHNKTGENFGDGLLRAALNYCYLNGIKKVYHDKTDSYLLRKGFVRNLKQVSASELNSDIQNSCHLVCIVDEFFSKGCS